MPDAPGVSPITHYLFENPWPIVVIGVLTAIILFIAATRTGNRSFLAACLIPVLLCIAVWLLAGMVTTSGEHATGTVRSLITSAVQRNVPLALSHFDQNATLTLGSPNNAGLGRSYIDEGIGDIGQRYRIESNNVSSLHAYSLDSETAEVHVRCTTQIAFERGIALPVRSGWVFRVESRGGGWLITRITFVDYDGQTPTMDIF